MSQATTPTFQTTLQQYTQDISQMSSYATAIANTQLPNLSGFEIIDPTDYNNLSQAYESLVGSANDWLSGPQIVLEGLVTSLQNTSALANDQLVNAIAAAQLLQTTPADATALQSLNQNLISLSNVMSALSTNINKAASEVTAQQDIISNNTSALTTITNDITNLLAAANVDVASIQNSINTMNQTISSLQNDIVWTEILEGGGGVLMLIGFGLAITLNPLSFVVFFGGIVAASIEVGRRALDEQALATLQIQVNNLQNELTSDTAAAAAAQSAASTANSLTAQLNTILQNGSAIQQIEDFVNTVVTDIEQIQQSVQQAIAAEGNWPQVISDLESAQNEWQAIQQLVGNDSDFSISFSPAQATVLQAAA